MFSCAASAFRATLPTPSRIELRRMGRTGLDAARERARTTAEARDCSGSRGTHRVIELAELCVIYIAFASAETFHQLGRRSRAVRAAVRSGRCEGRETDVAVFQRGRPRIRSTLQLFLRCARIGYCILRCYSEPKSRLVAFFLPRALYQNGKYGV